MFRYQKYNYLIQNFQLSKLKIFNASNLVTLDAFGIQAGHFKPNSIYVEHGLLVAGLTGQVPSIELFKHGKRLRNTALIKTSAIGIFKWAILDRFLNLFLPTIGDLKTFKTKKPTLVSSEHSWRVRSFFEWPDADVLLSDRILKKDVFLPLFVNISLSSRSHLYSEQMLRMLRIPATFYRKDRPLAGDDLIN
jgi:hypothetical protein